MKPDDCSDKRDKSFLQKSTGQHRSLRRMDSMMIDSNIKRMTRLELLYHCVARMVQVLNKQNIELPEQLQHYLNKDDENLVIYYNKSEDTSSKITKALADASIPYASDSFYVGIEIHRCDPAAVFHCITGDRTATSIQAEASPVLHGLTGHHRLEKADRCSV